MIDDDKLVCKICGKVCTNYSGIGHHIAQTHKMTIKNYYDIYYKINNEDICNNESCNNITTFYSIGRGYAKYCSITCMNKSNQHKKDISYTKKIRYNDENYNNRKQYEQTCLERYNSKHNWSGEARKTTEKTWIKKYGVNNPWKNEQIQNKCKNTFAKNHNGKQTPFQIPDIQQKAEKLANSSESKRKANKTREQNGNRSKYELYFKQLLDEKNINYIEEYISDEYPFACDFYLVDFKLYVELHIYWMHGKMPYDGRKTVCKKQLALWKEKVKYSITYKNAIDIWTKYDVKKLNILKKNKLNFKILYNKDEIDDFVSNLEV